MRQLVKTPSDVCKLVRAVEAQMVELELLILREPTGYPREQLTEANIHFMLAISALKEVA